MSGVETVILTLLVLMVVPDLCTRLGRPGLAYAVFVVLGIMLGPVFPAEVKTMSASRNASSRDLTAFSGSSA